MEEGMAEKKSAKQVACLAFLISSGTRGFYNDDRGEAEISVELYFELGFLKIGWTWETLVGIRGGTFSWATT